MRFFKTVKYLLREYIKLFSGRASLSEYWNFWVSLGLVNLILSVIENPIIYFNYLFNNIPITGETNVIIAIISPITISIIISLFVRRLHDIDISGWWLAIPIIPILLLLINGNTNIISEHIKENIILSITGYYIVMLIMIIGRKGTDGDNRFGKDPLLQTK